MDTALVLIGAIVLTMAGQAVTAQLDLVGIFDPGAGPEHAATFPATMPLAGAAFVMMLQLTPACERWPLRRVNRTLSGVLALVISAVVGVVSTWTVVAVHGAGRRCERATRPRDRRRFRRADRDDRRVADGLLLLLRGWPLNRIEPACPG